MPYYDYALDIVINNHFLSGDIDSEELNEMVWDSYHLSQEFCS